MADSPDVGGNVWGQLINSDKTASPLFEQLCLGLTYIIRKFGTGPEDKLTPERIAAFYRSVGGNLDNLFLGSSDAGAKTGTRYSKSLSFMYRTLGCYHSLEPTPNAFETPCIPCLTPAGFVRWQTIQLLLCPDEHATYFQKAVQLYDVPRPGGRTFSKTIPRDAFPEKPDAEMEKWHKSITQQLNQEYIHSIKNSPFTSPAPQPNERADGYFGHHIPQIRRPSRSSRERSSEEDRRRPRVESRRSSVADVVSPDSPDAEYGRPPSSFHSRDGKRRSVSAQRNGLTLRPRAATTGYSAHQRNSSASSHRDSYDRPDQGSQRRTPPYGRQEDSSRYRSATAEDDPSGEEASSEDSLGERQRRQYNSSPRNDYRKRGLLLPVLNAFSGRRRHSHDASALSREDQSRRDDFKPSRLSPTEQSSRPQQSVHFKQDMFGDGGENPESPVQESRFVSGRRSDTYPRGSGSDLGHPQAHHREGSSGSGSERRPGSGHESYHRGNGSRNREVPLRVSTVTGVGGRRYANAEPNSPGRNSGPEASQREPKMRYSVAV